MDEMFRPQVPGRPSRRIPGAVRARAACPAGSIALLLAATLRLPVTPAGAEPMSGDPQLLLIPQRSVPMFSCTVLVPAGSALETPETNGAAHYLEHLLFNGTETRTRERIYAEGDLLGAYNNASTQRERTVFQLLLPSENWKEGLELQADMLLHSTLPQDMFEKEQGIILEELAKDRTSADYLAERRTAEILWGGDPRALPVLGSEGSIRGMEPEALRAFYRDRYRPAGMTIVLMGDFDEAAARAEILRLYGEGGAPPPPLPPSPPFPSPAARHFRAVPGLGKTRVSVMLPAAGVTSPDYAAAELLARLLTDGERAAVSPAVERAVGPVQSCSAGLSAGDAWSLLTVSADFAPEPGRDPAEAGAAAADAILRHLKGLADGAAVAHDLVAAQRGALVEEISLHEKMHYYGLMRADLLGGPDPSLALQLPERIRAADAAAVTGALRQALRAGDVLATVLAEGIADRSDPLGDDPFSFAGAEPAPVAASAAEAAIPTPPAPVAAPESRRVVLENGLTLIVKATPDARTFAAHLLFRDRARREEAGGVPRGTSDVVHRMMALGTEGRTEDELRGDLARSGIALKVTDSDGIPYDDYYFSPEYSYVRVETIDSFALDALALLGRIVLHPRFTPETFAKAKAAAVARARREQATPRSVASNLFLDALGSGHPEEGGVLGPASELEELTLEDARRHHARMTAPDAMALVVSGNLPADLVERAVRDAFASGHPAPLPAGGGWEPAPVAAAVRESATGREQSWIVVGTPLRVPAGDEPSVRVAAAVLSERLAEQLREREGLAYSIGADLRLEGDGSYIRMQAGTRPENLERMEAGMREVAAGLAARPPTEEEIEGARNRGEGRRRMRRLSRMGDAYAMAMAELAGRDPLALDADLPALRAATPADVARVTAAHLTFDPAVVAIAR